MSSRCLVINPVDDPLILFPSEAVNPAGGEFDIPFLTIPVFLIPPVSRVFPRPGNVFCLRAQIVKGDSHACFGVGPFGEEDLRGFGGAKA